MPTLLQKAAGAAGSYLRNTTGPVESVARKIVQTVAPKFTLASSLQNWGGQSNSNMPFKLIPQVMASDGSELNTGGQVSQNLYGFSSANAPASGYVDPVTRTVINNPVVKGSNEVKNTGDAESVINQGVQSDFDIIERDYQDALNQANISEESVNRQGNLAQQEIQSQGETTKEAARQELATAQQGIAEQGQTASKTLKTGLQGARDLFRQTQQQNIAQLSALGLSSSSVMEGLAERLGVETARRMAGLTGSYEEVTQNLAKEGARVKDYAAAKIRQIEENVGLQIKSIQGQMVDAISLIGQQRNVAATAKASARADVLSQARQQIYNLQASAQTFAQQMQAWATQKAQSLADVNKEFTISQQGLGQAVQSAVSQMPTLGGLTYVPEIQQGSNQLYKIGGKYVKSTQDEELANPFATQ